MGKTIYITPKQLAELRQIPYQTAVSWARNGWIPGVRKNSTLSGNVHYEIPASAADVFQPPKRGPKKKGGRGKP